MVEMIWKEPPPAVSSEKAPVLAELQKNPGRWALVQTRYKSSSGATAWRKLGCEAAHRRVESADGKSMDYDIYARWPEAKTGTAKTASRCQSLEGPGGGEGHQHWHRAEALGHCPACPSARA